MENSAIKLITSLSHAFYQKTHMNGKLLVLFLSVSVSMTMGFLHLVVIPGISESAILHSQTINHTAFEPYRHRILVPYLVEFIRHTIPPIQGERYGFYFAYGLIHLVALTVFLVALYRWLCYWQNENYALIGVLFVACLLQFPMSDSTAFLQLNSLVEAGLFTITLIAIYTNRIITLFILVIIASLNRETSVFFSLAALFACINSEAYISTVNLKDSRVKTALLLFLVTVLMYAGIRYYLGPETKGRIIRSAWEVPRTYYYITIAVLNWSSFFGLFWIFIFRNLKLMPTFLRNMALILPIYYFAIGTWGNWQEIRTLLITIPILVPIGLISFCKSPNQTTVNDK